MAEKNAKEYTEAIPKLFTLWFCVLAGFFFLSRAK